MTDKVIVIIQMGHAIPSALEKFGDFDKWFIRGMDIDPIKTKTYHVHEDTTFPEVKTIAGIIITGSATMVTEELAWSEETINWLRQFLSTDIPILGVCYGHQLLAKLLGGTVDWNPRGRQIGQIHMTATDDTSEDVLFKEIIESHATIPKFLATHQQSVTKLPDEVVLLGSTELDPYHSFRYKNHIWGTQFHPEFTPEIIRDYIHFRSHDIIKDGLNPTQLLEEIEDENHGYHLLHTFRDICFSI